MKDSNTSKQISVRITNELNKQFKILAIQNEKTIQEYLIELIKKEVEKK